MTPEEFRYAAASLVYYPPSWVSPEIPIPLIATRAEIDGQGNVTVHGTALQGFMVLSVGDPQLQGAAEYPAAPLVATPTAGSCTLRAADAIGQGAAAVEPVYGTLKRRDAEFTIALLADTWAVLTGGTLGETTLDPLNYTSNTGELVVPTAGVYAVSLSVTASRSGLTAPTVDIAVYADGALTDVEEQTGLALASQPGSLHARAHIELAAGAVLTPRIRSSLGLTLGVPRWTLAFERVG